MKTSYYKNYKIFPYTLHAGKGYSVGLTESFNHSIIVRGGDIYHGAGNGRKKIAGSGNPEP